MSPLAHMCEIPQYISHESTANVEMLDMRINTAVCRIYLALTLQLAGENFWVCSDMYIG